MPSQKMLKIQKSRQFPLIMEKFNDIGNSISGKDFYEQYVVKLDPDISIRGWYKLMGRLRADVKTASDAIMRRVVDKKVTEVQMEENSMKKILAIADITLDEVVDDPKILEQISVQDRMDWLFKAMKSRDTRMLTLTKVQAENRKTSMYEDIFKGAQYGTIKEDEMDKMDDVEEAEVVQEPPPKPLPPPPEPPKGPVKSIEFSPDDLK